ncbi:c-type cytochrome, partial [Achromobacter insolitus]
MHLKSSLLLAAACVLGAGAAQAQTTGLDLAKNKACMACHQVEAKRVGPPLKSVAERYAGQGDAMVDYLAGKI